MSQQRAALVFDLDGTLVDSRRDIARAANVALVEHGYPALPTAEIAGFVGDGARVLLARAARIAASDPALSPLVESFVAFYAEHPAPETSCLPHARELLRACAALPLALCTNKPRRVTLPLLRALELDRHFCCVVAGGDTRAHKPDPEPLFAVAAQLQLEARHLVMIGDADQDVYAARAAGARSIAIRGAFQAAQRLEQSHPDALLSSLAEVPALLSVWGILP